MNTTYGSTTYRKKGIEKEKIHFFPLKEYFKSKKINLTQSTHQENIKKKVDYWGFKEGYLLKGFDFKTGDYPHNGFSMTYKMCGTSKNVFEVGYPNITYIYLLEHKNTYAFVKKSEVYKWYLENKPKLKDCKTPGDDSNWFWIPTKVVEKLKFMEEVNYKTLK